MCHPTASSFFPLPGHVTPMAGAVDAFAHGPDDAKARIAIIPDIFGCSPFYQGLAAYWGSKGARAFLIDPYSRWGELAEATREAAFARRGKIEDSKFLDALTDFVRENRVTGVMGFCLGGLYIFELARRGLAVELVGLYGFPQGLANQDPIPTPFDYLETVETPFTMIMGRDDASVGPANLARLEAMAPTAPAMTLVMLDGVGHGFLAALDQPAGVAATAARRALRQCEEQFIP